jgi:hypothetical protein
VRGITKGSRWDQVRGRIKKGLAAKMRQAQYIKAFQKENQCEWWRCRELNPVARQLTALLKLLDIFSLTGIECTTFMVYFVPVYAVFSDSYSVSYSSDVLIFTLAYPPTTDRPCRGLHGSRTSLREKQGIELVPEQYQNGSVSAESNHTTVLVSELVTGIIVNISIP